jgi:hypothetical protein
VALLSARPRCAWNMIRGAHVGRRGIVGSKAIAHTAHRRIQVPFFGAGPGGGRGGHGIGVADAITRFILIAVMTLV